MKITQYKCRLNTLLHKNQIEIALKLGKMTISQKRCQKRVKNLTLEWNQK